MDSCGENDAKLEQRKKKIHNCIISMQTAEAMKRINLLKLSH